MNISSQKRLEKVTQPDIAQKTIPSRNWRLLSFSTSVPSASRTAPTTYWAMELDRRRRAWAKNAGREEGGGTLRTCIVLVFPGREIDFDGNGFPLRTASRKAATPQPAGEMAPHPCIKTRFRTICAG